MKKMVSLLCSVITIFFVSAREYRVKNAVELSSNSYQPGDKIILVTGDWNDQRLVFKANGTEQSPITLTTEKPGQVKLTGNSSLVMDGSWLVADGLYFTNGFSKKEDVIVLSTLSSHCRLTNTAIVNFNNPDKTVDYKWVSLFGNHNRVDHCWLEGKTHRGTTLVVWLSDSANYHQIDHNYFGKRPPLGENGGESIRVGTSAWSFHDSYTTVEYNIFEQCNGEIEIISNKSCKNIFRNNLFYECEGTLTLRHGNSSEVYGNFFIGNNLPKTGGVRIICENHQVHDNYFQGLTGTGLSAALSFMEGEINPEPSSHWQVKNASVTGNIFINCKEAVAVGAGKNDERNLPPLGCAFTGNIIIGTQEPVNFYDNKATIRFSQNSNWGMKEAVTIRKGFLVKNPNLQKHSSGLWFSPAFTSRPFWNTNNTGPAWKRGLYKIVVKD